MRKILFRAKTKDTQWWIEGHYAIESNHACFENELKHTHFIFKDEFMDWGIGGLVQYEVIPETVGQFTGLIDKNGKGIFEGDIVKHYHDKKFPESYSKGYIFWDEEYLRWKRTSENVNCCIANDCIYEVIGNIHDNPELLNN
jgi:uncharacterized phage protein (TIGR01671 family)